MKGSKPIIRLTGLGAFFLLSGMSTAYAGGFQLFEQNVSSLGNAYAGTAAVAQDASTAFYNPAGLTLLNSPEIDASASYIDLDIDAHVKSATSNSLVGLLLGAPPVPVLGNDHVSAGSRNIVPALNAAFPQCHRFAFGMSITSPYGLNTHYDGSSKVKYLATWSKVSTIDVGPSAALQLTPQFSVGAGVDIQYLKANLYQKVPVGETIPAIFGGPFPDGEITNRARDKNGWGWNAGALYQFNCGTRVGLDYRSRVHHHLKGEVDLTLPEPLNSETGFLTSTVTLPDTANLSVYTDINCHWALLGSVNWTHWSLIDEVVLNYSGPITDSLEQADLTLAFRDTYRVAVGANYAPTCRWKFRAGVAYDEAPIRNAHTRTFRLPDDTRYWAAVGVQYKISECLLIDAGYSHLFVKDTTAHQAKTTPLTSGAALFTDVSADFDSQVNQVGLQLSWRIL